MKGTLVFDMVAAAGQIGLNVKFEYSNVESLISLLEKGKPAIALLDISFVPRLLPIIRYPIYHHVVVTGYSQDKDSFRMHDGRHEARFMKRKKFEKRWKYGKNWIMYHMEKPQ